LGDLIKEYKYVENKHTFGICTTFIVK
jgi:hypothetical protein